jgi:aldose 1-epimerase
VNEVRFASADVEVVVLPEVGARLHRLRAFGHELLRTPPDPEAHRREPFYWGCFTMAPWCNRIEADRIEVGRRTIELGSNFDDGSAIHGQVYDRPWADHGDGSFAVSGGGDGWPWTYEVGLRLEVVGQVVRIEQVLRNTAADPMPAGLGLHPWFRRPIEVAIGGDEVYTPNTGTPARPVSVADAFDLRRLGGMPSGLDATWARLADPPVELRWPDLGVHAVLRATGPTVHIVAASPDDLDAIAIEPETHAPQGLRRLRNGEPGALAWLDPGRELRLVTELTFARGAPGGATDSRRRDPGAGPPTDGAPG